MNRPLGIDDHDASLYTVGQVAEMLGVQPAYLRRLDAENVVRPSRSSGNQRRYSRVEIHLIVRATELADQGMTLVGIRRLLELEAEVDRLRIALAEAVDANEETMHTDGSGEYAP